MLEIWRADFTVPFAYSRDALANLLFIKETVHDGWPLHNSLLGAPFGSDLYDFPVVAGDVLHLLIIKFFGLFTSDPAEVMNLFYLVQFPIVGLAALWSFRRLGVSTWIAVACAVVFSLAPYHFYRGEIHLFLAGYWAVPLGLYLVVTLLMGRPLLRSGDADGALSLPGLVLIGVIIGLSEVYYASLTVILLLAAAGLSLFRPDWRRLLVSGAAAVAIIAVAVAAAHAPTIIYHARHGQNAEIAKSRDPAQSDTFGMRVTRLILPVHEHRLAPLAKLTARYERDSPPQLDEEDPQALGTVGAAGFIALIVIALASILPGVRRRRSSPLLLAAALTALIATLAGEAGGFSGIISYFISHTIRSWNRYSVFIAFVALLPVAAVLERLRLAMARRGLGAVTWAFALSALVALAAIDQTGRTLVPPYKALKAQWNGEIAFVHQLEQRLPKGAEVYETPYYPFPEWGYELARGYFHTNDLRWSFGAMEGRPADWARSLVGQAGRVIIPSVAAAGFDAIYVDRQLYTDDGAAADSDLRAALGPPFAVSSDRRFDAYDLRPFAARLRQTLGPAQFAVLKGATLYPPRAEFGPEFGPEVPSGTIFAQAHERWSTQPTSYIDLINPSKRPRDARVQVTFETEVTARLAVIEPGGTVVPLTVGQSGVPFDHVFRLKPGRTRISLVSNVKVNPNRKNYIGLLNFRLMDATAQSLAIGAGKALE